MRILYCAIDQTVPAAHGGSVHITSVAEGLAALGHDVHVIVTPGVSRPSGAVNWHGMRPPYGIRQLRLLRARRVRRLAEQLRPDVIIERYYNFGGEGLLAATRVGALAVLDVISPVIDYPGSPKRRLDRLLLIRPMERWRNWQCGAADLIITPLAGILPGHVPPERILENEVGADVARFHPHAKRIEAVPRGASDTVVIFTGAFRAWHGAVHLVEAIRRLRARGRRDVRAVLVGGGPELTRVRQAAHGIDGITLTGPVAHEDIPGYLAAADVGVAPFDVTAHAPLSLGFYWSPLKVFEYMAAGLPVVVPRIDRLASIVRDGIEGALYEPSDPDGLAATLERLTDPSLRAPLGRAARLRAERDFSWRRHCEAIDRALHASVQRRAG
jgi:glycosyltransferase involved in cell wall biosynthesis